MERIEHNDDPTQTPEGGRITGSQSFTHPQTQRLASGTTESELWTGRTHWRHFAGRIALWAFGNVVVSILLGVVASKADWLSWTGAMAAVFGVVLVSGAIVLGRVALKVLGTYYRLTSQRLFIERGILGRTVDQMELIRVDDVRMVQTFLDRIFAVGSISLLTTDSTDRAVTIEGVEKPDSVAEAIRTQMRTLRGKSLYVESL